VDGFGWMKLKTVPNPNTGQDWQAGKNMEMVNAGIPINCAAPGTISLTSA